MNTHSQEIDFLASVTHDLKSPLNAIMCTLSMLKEKCATEHEFSEALHIAETASKEMLDLVNNMLTTARMQAGKESIHPRLHYRADLAEQARSMEHTFRIEAMGKQVDFSVSIIRLPEFVYWDIQKVRLFAINNLISNALKFVGHAGGTVRVLIDSDDLDNVIITVADDGPGIPVGERKEVFEKFTRASNNARSFQGGGFGLFNACQTIEMHHGSIEILDGLNGKGVTFKISIPAVPFAVEAQEPLMFAIAA